MDPTGRSRTTDDPWDVVANLQIALESRDIIGQAKGILMERHGITADQAFIRLQTMSQRSNIKLRDIAAYLIDLRVDDPERRPDIDRAATT